MKPPRSVLDRSFRYTNAASTDVRKTWKRARERMQEQAKTVVPLQRKEKK